MNSRILKNSGIDIEKGVNRFLGDRQLFENILLTFLEDETFKKGEIALKKEDYNDLYECIHTLKGVAGNTDMTQLFRTTDALCDYIRKNETLEKKKVNSLFNEVEEAYHCVLAGIIAAREV